MKSFFTLLFILFSFYVNAQEGPISTLQENGKHYKAIEFNVKKNTFYTQIIPNFLGSSITIETDVLNNFDGAYILLGGVEKFFIKKDDEQTENIRQQAERSSNQSSGLLMAKAPFEFFSFYSGNLDGKIRINILYAAPLKKTFSKDKKKSSNDCSIQPESIDQSIWRSGLPNPKPNPSYSQVKHIILHHAAGSNTDTDYTNTVRSYYLLHTQTNGWDDIGYNFLVAPNGDIYDGRQGDSLGDDNVIGAHMCARNTNTMGICLLGNYEVANVYPTDTAISSINQLITWKLWKEQLLNPYDSSQHPVVNPVMYLGVIAGHRQGCNPGYTSCPGQNYFNQIEPRVRAKVAISLANCSPNGINTTKKTEVLLYPNPIVNGSFTVIAPEPITEIIVMNMLGQVVLKKEIEGYSFNESLNLNASLENQKFIVRIQTIKSMYYFKLVSK